MSENVDRAIRLAAELHKGQVRDGEKALPYIVHPIEVLSNLRYVGGVTEEDMLVAAALHDTVEESGVELTGLKKDFGPRVESLVKELTREEPSPEQTVGLTPDEIWSLRSKMLLAEIARMSRDAQQLKLADRLSNVKEGLRT